MKKGRVIELTLEEIMANLDQCKPENKELDEETYGIYEDEEDKIFINYKQIATDFETYDQRRLKHHKCVVHEIVHRVDKEEYLLESYGREILEYEDSAAITLFNNPDILDYMDGFFADELKKYFV